MLSRSGRFVVGRRIEGVLKRANRFVRRQDELRLRALPDVLTQARFRCDRRVFQNLGAELSRRLMAFATEADVLLMVVDKCCVVNRICRPLLDSDCVIARRFR